MRLMLKMIVFTAALLIAGYVGTLWQLTRDQAATIAELKAMGEARVIDCAAAQAVAECATAYPGSKCEITTAEAAK